MDTPISRAEHEAFAKLMESENQRLKDEDTRQNKRIDLLEDTMREVSSLAASVEKLATNMENMVEIQKQQGKRLETLEGRDGEKWRQTVGYIISAVIGAVVGFFSR